MVCIHWRATCQIRTIAITGAFHAHAFIGARRITIVNEKEGADRRFFAAFNEGFNTIQRDADYFTSGQVTQTAIADIGEGGRFHRDRIAIAIFLLAQHHGGAAKTVTRCVQNTLRREQQQGSRSLNTRLRVMDTGFNRLLRVNQNRNHFKGVNLPFLAQFAEVGVVFLFQLGHEFVQVRHQADQHQCVHSQMRAHQKGLIIVVTNNTNAIVGIQACKTLGCTFKTDAELRVLNVVNRTMESVTCKKRHTTTHSSHVRMVVGTKENIRNAALLSYNAKKSAHNHSLQSKEESAIV